MKLTPESPAVLPNRSNHHHYYSATFTLSLSERPEEPNYFEVLNKIKRIIRKIEIIEPRLIEREWIIRNNERNLEKCFSLDKDYDKCVDYFKKKNFDDFEFSGEINLPTIQNGREFGASIGLSGNLGSKPIGDMPALNGVITFDFGTTYECDWKSKTEVGALDSDQLQKISEIILAEFAVSWARVSDQDYTFRLDNDANPCDSYQVFEHRYAGGWMILVNKPITPSDVPEAEDVISLENGKSLIVTTKEHFSSYNLEHVEKARAVEVRLNELGLLPALGIPISD